MPKNTARPNTTVKPAEADRDYTYLAQKAPSDLHEDMAVWLQEKMGLSLDAEERQVFLKAVQATAVLRMVYQRSDRNKARESYKALDEAVVAQRSTHMIQAHQDAQKEIQERLQRDAVKAEARKKAAAASRAKRAAKKEVEQA